MTNHRLEPRCPKCGATGDQRLALNWYDGAADPKYDGNDQWVSVDCERCGYHWITDPLEATLPGGARIPPPVDGTPVDRLPINDPKIMNRVLAITKKGRYLEHCRTAEDLAAIGAAELRKCKNFGPATVQAIRRALAQVGLTLAD